MSERLRMRSFAARKISWKASNKTVCRHGVFFASSQAVCCPCMSTSSSEDDWHLARHMASLDHELRAIIVVPWDSRNFKRLGQLRAEMRRLNW
eukprot:5561140-Karenia_brevis.AAC.1